MYVDSKLLIYLFKQQQLTTLTIVESHTHNSPKWRTLTAAWHTLAVQEEFEVPASRWRESAWRTSFHIQPSFFLEGYSQDLLKFNFNSTTVFWFLGHLRSSFLAPFQLHHKLGVCTDAAAFAWVEAKQARLISRKIPLVWWWNGTSGPWSRSLEWDGGSRTILYESRQTSLMKSMVIDMGASFFLVGLIVFEVLS